MVNPGDVRKAGSLCLQDQGRLHILKALRSWRRERGPDIWPPGPHPAFRGGAPQALGR